MKKSALHVYFFCQECKEEYFLPEYTYQCPICETDEIIEVEEIDDSFFDIFEEEKI